MTLVFVISVGLLLYTLVGYPLLLLGLWKLRGLRPVPPPVAGMDVDFLIPAHNEAAVIADKLRNTLSLDNSDGHNVRIIVISDGSTDGTVSIANSIEDPRIEVMETPGRSGKLEAMNIAMERMRGDVIIFSDANALLSNGAMTQMMRHYADPHVGGVCGQITIARKKGAAIAEADSLFWRYDQMLKYAESGLGGTVSAQGSIHSVRRALVDPIPPGVADDFILSVRAVQKGYRLVFEPKATTTEMVTEAARDEVGRRIRSTEMGWRGLMLTRSVMNPFRHGLYAWQMISHKFLRRLMPLFLLMALLSNLLLIGQGWGWAVLAVGQLTFYSIALLAYLVPATRNVPLWGKVMFFVMSNIAMALGILAYYRGRESSIWTPVREDTT